MKDKKPGYSVLMASEYYIAMYIVCKQPTNKCNITPNNSLNSSVFFHTLLLSYI